MVGGWLFGIGCYWLLWVVGWVGLGWVGLGCVVLCCVVLFFVVFVVWLSGCLVVGGRGEGEKGRGACLLACLPACLIGCLFVWLFYCLLFCCFVVLLIG